MIDRCIQTPLSSQEKRRTKKALELKKEAEWKLEVVQREAHQLSSQVTTARAQLKLSRKRTHQLELNQSKVVCQVLLYNL